MGVVVLGQSNHYCVYLWLVTTIMKSMMVGGDWV